MVGRGSGEARRVDRLVCTLVGDVTVEASALRPTAKIAGIDFHDRVAGARGGVEADREGDARSILINAIGDVRSCEARRNRGWTDPSNSSG